MQCKLSKNKGEDFMLKSIRKFFSMILPICMLVTTAPCIISTAEGEIKADFYIGDYYISTTVKDKQVEFFYDYDDGPSINSFPSVEGNNEPIATLSSINENVIFSKKDDGTKGFFATNSDGDNFTLKLKVTDDAKKQGWMGTIAIGQSIYNQEVNYEITENDARDSEFYISLQKGKYIEIEKPSGDFDEKKFSKAISVTDYEGNTFFFGKGSNYTQAVQGEDGAGDGPGGGIKVTVEDEAPFTCVEKICEGTGIDIKVTDSAKSYTLRGTGTCKLRFKDNRKGVWLAGNDGSECGYVEVSTYANDEDKANDKIIGTREIVKAGGYYYSDAGKSEIVHVKFVPNDGYMTTIKKVKENDGATAEDVFVKLSGDEKNDNEKHYLTYNSIYAKKIENFGDYFKEKIPEGKAGSDTNLKTVEVEKTASGKIYSAKFDNATSGDKVAMDKWVKYTIGENYLTQELGTYEVTVSEIFDETSGSFKVEETEDFVTITLTLNAEAKEKLKELMNRKGKIKVVRNHKGEITFLPDEDVNFDLEKGTITFRSNKSSTYGFYIVTDNAIANNVVSANNLKTGEDASYLTFLGVLLVTGGWLFILSKRKNKILK